MSPTPRDGAGFSRRSFLKGASVTAGSAAAALGAASAPAATAGRTDARRFAADGTHDIELRINGSKHTVQVETRTTLLDALRGPLGLTGSKQVCDRGACGGCTVLLDDQPINSCLTLAFDAVGHDVRTIEGLAQGERLHPLQRAFVHCDALQCGFCTPGMIMSGVACIERHGKPTRDDIVHDMSGNLCRCGTYGRVIEAIERAATEGDR